MVKIENFTESIKGLKVGEFPEDLKTLHEFVLESTENGTNWNAYQEPDVKPIIDAYFEKLNAFLNQESKTPSAPVIKTVVPEHTPHQKIKSEKKRPAKTKKVPVVEPEEEELPFDFVERIPEEIRVLRRFLSFNGKRKTREDFLRFINFLHKAIIEKRIRKASPYAKQINYIQTNLLKVYNSMGKSIPVEINNKTVLEFKELIASEKVMPSVQLIKRYINLNGKYGVKEKCKSLLEAMTRAFDKGKITKKDKYFNVFDNMHFNLSNYIKSKTHKVLSIERTELNGLNGFLEGCGCGTMLGNENELSGIEATPQTPAAPSPELVMSSMDFANMKFKTLGFTGKYLKLIGDPARGFTTMVFGKPKMGKSFLCIDFAGYLARNHGKVLYVAKEEGLDFTLQEKLKAKEVAHPNLFVTGSIPPDLTQFDFIFLDSVNKLGLSSEDLQALKQNNTGKSFIYVFQSTKEGNFRGGNGFQHDVDVVIEVPEKGKAIQNGRFNQGGEMDIFGNEY